MRRPSGPTIAALAGAALTGLLYVSPVLKDVVRTGLDWPIWIDHPEGLIHTNAGKWLVAPPHRYFVEGASGEFPHYYPSLSDVILNVVGAALGIPTMTVQAVLVGPLLGAAFLLFNHLSLAAVLRDRRVALGAALLISFGGNASFRDRLDPVSGLQLAAVLHVPFHVISLATSQSLGWVLLLPALCLGYLAHREFGRARAVGAGLLLGLLFYSHTLTFVNVAAAQLGYLVLSNALERPRDRRFKAWLAAVGLGAFGFTGLVAVRGRISFAEIVALGTLALGATFLVDPNRRFYLWCYGTAGLLALPYLMLLFRHRASFAAMQSGWDQVQMMAVGVSGFLLFFSAYLVAAALACAFSRDRQAAVWLTAFLAAAAFLALNHLWGWGNHPYRYAIHLLFPLAILAAIGLRDAPRPFALLVGAWLCAVCLLNAWSFAAGRPVTVRFRVAEPERARFLGTVRDVTAREAGSGLRLLAPVELTYPRGLVQAAMLMNYARIPAFIPDYRHVLWPERYHNRMALFCFLFPGYPNQDYPFGWRACEEDLDPDPSLLTIRDPQLKAQILPIHRIAFAAAPGKPFSNHLKDAGSRYGWPIVVATDNAAFLRTDAAALPGVARLALGGSDGARLQVRVEPDRPGPHVLVLGGRFLERRAPQIRLDGRPLAGGARRGNWAVFETELSGGPHTLELPSLAEGPDPAADYLYFAAVVSREKASRYLALGAQTGLGAEERYSGWDDRLLSRVRRLRSRSVDQ
jgi:hypothetical protein